MVKCIGRTYFALLSACIWSNARGQLATGNDEDAHNFKPALFQVGGKRQPEAPGSILQIACGANHTLALLRMHTGLPAYLWGAGDASKGQLGLGATTGAVFMPLSLGDALEADEITMVQASWETSFVVARSSRRDRILSFGSNDFGLLGAGDKAEVEPVMEVHYTHLFTRTAGRLRVAHLKAGPRHVLAVVSQKTSEGVREMLIGWGVGRHGELEVRDTMGYSTPSSEPGPRRVPLPVRISTWVHPNKVIDIAIGNQHAVVLSSDGAILQLGSNTKSQLPSGQILGQPVRAFSTWNNSFIAVNHELSLKILSYGRNSHGQLGRNKADGKRIALPPWFRVEDMVCGSEHSMVLGKREATSEHTELWGWGWNEHGNLASGHTEDIIFPTRIALPCECDSNIQGPCEECHANITGIWAGCGTSWVATSD